MSGVGDACCGEGTAVGGVVHVRFSLKAVVTRSVSGVHSVGHRCTFLGTSNEAKPAARQLAAMSARMRFLTSGSLQISGRVFWPASPSRFRLAWFRVTIATQYIWEPGSQGGREVRGQGVNVHGK